jgi:hypothetical protein
MLPVLRVALEPPPFRWYLFLNFRFPAKERRPEILKYKKNPLSKQVLKERWVVMKLLNLQHNITQPHLYT